MAVSSIVVLSQEAISICVMAILLYSLMFENSENTKATRFFTASCACTLLALAFDIPCWALEDKPGYDSLLYFVNILSYLFPLGTVAFVAHYEMEIIGGRGKRSCIHARIISVMCAVSAVLILIGSITGSLFFIEDGVFFYGPWYPMITIVPFAALIHMDVVAIIHRKILGVHDTIAFLVYMVAPVATVILEAIYPDVGLALCGASLGSLLLYVMLQSGHVSHLNLRSEILEELACKDMLTGLFNRRAYDRVLDTMDQRRRFGFIFCDVNGLKLVNDLEGHHAGDDRLKRFADILRNHFSIDSLYRISGDEFVVIVPNLDPESFYKRVKALRQDLAHEDDIAAAGAATGIGADKKLLLAAAEERMYQEKQLCHARHPEYKR